jgi:hypothetical protein
MTTKFTCLDLCAGVHGFSAAMHRHPDWEVISVDITASFDREIELDRWGIATMTVETVVPHDIIGDVANLTPLDVPDDIDLIVASPPCTTYTLAAISTHRHPDGSPKTEKAAAHDRLLIELYNFIQTVDPDYYVVENPMGKMRKRAPFNDPDAVITQCQYGKDVMKPTDLWGRFPSSFEPKRCSNGDDCHEAAPRGSNTGTQGKACSADRSKIPDQLSKAIRDGVMDDAGAEEQTRLFQNFDDTADDHPPKYVPYCPECRQPTYGTAICCGKPTVGWGHPRKVGCPVCNRTHRDHDDPDEPCDICAAANNGTTPDDYSPYLGWIDPPCTPEAPPVATATLRGSLVYVPKGYNQAPIPPTEEIHLDDNDREVLVTKHTLAFDCPECNDIHRALTLEEPAPHDECHDHPQDTIPAAAVPSNLQSRPPTTIATTTEKNPNPTISSLTR